MQMPSIQGIRETVLSSDFAKPIITSAALTTAAKFFETRTVVPLCGATGAAIGTGVAVAQSIFSEEGATARNVAVAVLSTLAMIAAVEYGAPILLAKAGLSALPTVGLQNLVAFNALGQLMLVAFTRNSTPTTFKGIQNAGDFAKLHETLKGNPAAFAALSTPVQALYNVFCEHHGLEKLTIVKKEGEVEETIAPTLDPEALKTATEKEIISWRELNLETKDKDGVVEKSTTWKDVVTGDARTELVRQFAKLNRLSKEEKEDTDLAPTFDQLSIKEQRNADLNLVLSEERLAKPNAEKPDAPSTDDRTLKALHGMKHTQWVTFDEGEQDLLNKAFVNRELKLAARTATPTTKEAVEGLEDGELLNALYSNYENAELTNEANEALCARFYKDGKALKEGMNLSSVAVPTTQEELEAVNKAQLVWIHAKVDQDEKNDIKPDANNGIREALNDAFKAAGLKEIDFSKPRYSDNPAVRLYQQIAPEWAGGVTLRPEVDAEEETA